MLKVAITGNIAAGKSAVEKFLKSKKICLLDTDKVTHKLQESPEVIEKITDEFKNFDILEDGKISRPRLAKIVFTDFNAKTALEGILHPLIKDEIRQFFLENVGEKIAFVSVPLLFETGFDKLFDKILLVYTDDEIRLKRLMKRNNMTKANAKIRLNNQMPQGKKFSRSDYIIKNNGTIEELNNQIQKILDELL